MELYNASPNWKTDGPGSEKKSLHLLFGIKSNVVHISTGVNDVFSAKLDTWKSGQERLGGF